VLATLARIQYFVIAPAYVVAAIWIERRQAPRKHALAFAALAPAVVGALIGALGYYQVGRSSFSLQTLTWIPLQGYLVAALTGGVLVTHVPNPRYLALVSTGRKGAVGTWGPLSWEGRWAWHWKDHIDRKFVARYREAPKAGT
jgi:hypothetical protein